MKTTDIIDNNNLTMTSEIISENPNNVKMYGNHYRCLVKNGEGKQGTFYFTKGYGLKDGVKLTELVECLAMDSAYIDMESQDFMDNMGYEDIKESNDILKSVKRCTRKLNNLITDNLEEWEED